MKRMLLMLAAFTAMAATHLGAVAQNPTVAYYYEGFQNGKPTDMTYYDLDGLILNPYLQGTGLECGTWHIVHNSLTDENYYMASTSYFTTPGQANDWMITPPIKVYHKDAKLSWNSIVCDGSSRLDGYKVYISTKGTAVEDFETEPLFSIDAESSDEWQSHEVSLEKYAGQLVHIAFVNDSYDKYVLGIDNIVVSGPAPDATFTVTTPIMTDTGETHIAVALTNTYGTLIENCKLCYSHDGQTYSQEFTGLGLTQGKTAELAMSEAVQVPLGTSYVYKAWVEVDGDVYMAVEDSVRGTYFVSNRRTLVEEGTGTNCGYCPMGLVGMEYMEKFYPDNFISIAVHGSLSYLRYAGYDTFCGFSAYPYMLVDRRFMDQPAYADANGNLSLIDYGVEYYHLMCQRIIAEAELSGTATLTDWSSNRIEVKVDSRFVSNGQSEGYDIALILLEDSVTSPDGSLYPQLNSYGSTAYANLSIYGLKDTLEAVGGWAYKGTAVRMKHNHVARAAYNESFNGAGNDDRLPATLQGGETYTSNFVWEVPEGTVNNFNYTSIVAVMTDADGYVVNACKMPVTISPESVESLEAEAGLSVKTVGEGIVVETAAPATVQVFAADGTPVYSADGEGHRLIPVSHRGIYLVKVWWEDKCVTKKMRY